MKIMWMLCSYVDESFLFEVKEIKEIRRKNETNESRIYKNPLNNEYNQNLVILVIFGSNSV